MNQEDMVPLLDACYHKALQGLPGSESVEELARSYMQKSGSLADQADSLIRWQIRKCAATGFATGLGGLITLPVAIPSDIAVNLYVQVRMIGAIAYMGGYDLHDDKVRTLVYLCLLGNSLEEILKEAGINVGKKLTQKFIKSISIDVIKEINEIIGIKLITKNGKKGVINLASLIPVVSGIIGAGFDAVTTNTIGNKAKEIFIDSDGA